MDRRVQRVFISFSTYELIRAWGSGYVRFLPPEDQRERDRVRSCVDPGEVIHFRGLTLIPNDKVVGDEFWCEFGGLFG